MLKNFIQQILGKIKYGFSNEKAWFYEPHNRYGIENLVFSLYAVHNKYTMSDLSQLLTHRMFRKKSLIFQLGS